MVNFTFINLFRQCNKIEIKPGIICLKIRIKYDSGYTVQSCNNAHYKDPAYLFKYVQ